MASQVMLIGFPPPIDGVLDVQDFADEKMIIHVHIEGIPPTATPLASGILLFEGYLQHQWDCNGVLYGEIVPNSEDDVSLSLVFWYPRRRGFPALGCAELWKGKFEMTSHTDNKRLPWSSQGNDHVVAGVWALTPGSPPVTIITNDSADPSPRAWTMMVIHSDGRVITATG